MNEVTICTVIAKNYLAQARTLAQSFREYHPQGRLFVLVVDEIEGYYEPAAEAFTLVRAEALKLPNFSALAFRYPVRELCRAIRPYFLDYLFKTYGSAKLCFFEADITLHRPLDELLALLEGRLLVLTPRLLEPVELDYYQPDERAILRQGVYDSGFIGLAQHPDCPRFLAWWQDRVARQGEVEPAQGEQPWLELAPALFPEVYIHRDPGCNMSAWNLNRRCLEKTAGGYQVNGSPLTFFHYSGFPAEAIEAISSHQNRYTLADRPDLRPLLEDYHEALLRHGYQTASAWPYSYDFFRNGVAVPAELRRIWQRTKAYELYWPDPYASDQASSFSNWLNEPADAFKIGATDGPEAEAEVRQPELLVTNLAMELYRLEPERQAQFPDPLGRDRELFVRWFIGQAGLDPFFTEPMRASLAKLSQNALLKLYKQFRRLFENWVYETYRRETWVYRLYVKVSRLLEKLGIHHYFEGVVMAKIAYNSVLPAPSGVNASLKGAGQVPLGVNIIGYLRDESGIGRVARDIIAALVQQRVAVAQTSLNGPPNRQQDYAVLQLPTGNPHPINLFYFGATNLSVHHLLGDQFLQNRYNISYVWWELDRIPLGWLDKFKNFREIWVGTDFVQRVLASISSLPVIKIPPLIPPPGPATLSRAELGLPAGKHIFCFAFDPYSVFERKNPFAVIQAYRMAFGPRFEETLLVIKTKNMERFPRMAQRLQAEIEAVGGVLINRSMSREEIDSLFHACDTYVSLHRAEGFGATLAETMLLGKPVIATAYSGNMDFMTEANSYPVSYKLIEIGQDAGPYPKGNYWAEPDVEEAAALMQRVINHPEEVRQKGELARQTIEQNYSFERVARLMVERLEAIRAHLR